jgi:DNA topoisomerase VI subunit A
MAGALNQMLKMGVRIEQQAFAKHGLNFVHRCSCRKGAKEREAALC